MEFSTDSKVRRRQKRHVLNRYAMAAEERAILESNICGRLVEAFKKLPNFANLALQAWVYPLSAEGHIYAQ